MSSSRTKALFVPGLCCRSDIWEGAREFLPGIDPVALDWPWPERIASYEDAAEWLAGEIQAHRPRFVVGHSLGGIIALHLRGEQPGRTDWKPIVVDSFLVEPHEFFRNHVWQPKPELRERIAAMLEEERPRFPVLREVAMRDLPAGWIERALAEPASFVFGGRSGEHSAEVLAQMAGIPAGGSHDIRMLPRTSHFLMLEEPELFYETLGDVMNSGRSRAGQ